MTMRSVYPIILGIFSAILVFAISVLVACENSDKPIGEIRNAVVESKLDNGNRFDRYYVTLTKDGESIELKVRSMDEYKAIKEGSTVTVSYNREYYINELSFPNLSDDKGVDE